MGLLNLVRPASTEGEIGTAFAALVRERPDALLITGDAFFTSRRAPLATLAMPHALPTIYNAREFATAGGLMSYGARAQNVRSWLDSLRS
jgi:putative ABC transport system substrate-binding protein